MIAADTNILARFLIRDIEDQAQKVKELIDSGTTFYINAVVLSELSWVIQKIYGYTKEEFIWAIDFLFETEGFLFFDQEIVKKALSDYLYQSADFSDCLINQINLNKGIETITFDKKASNLSGMKLLK
ncbi:MAG: type II toxin-antitoxin system VapC family toxin [Balneola sp.]